MSRPIRIEIEDGWYHVISRGIERRDIFQDDSDRSDFLERLFGLTESHALLVHAYCLMGNHFHLQVQTPQSNLKDAMQRLLSGYAVRFNLRHRRAGPLFQGRYRAILAGEAEWISEVNRYIHLNPVRLESLDLGKQRQAEIRRGIEKPADEALVRRRLELLRAYPWSSYRAYAGAISPGRHNCKKPMCSVVLRAAPGSNKGRPFAIIRRAPFAKASNAMDCWSAFVTGCSWAARNGQKTCASI